MHRHITQPLTRPGIALYGYQFCLSPAGYGIVMAKQIRADEKYVIDLCDAILRDQASRQHRFDFLVGDSGRQLPEDEVGSNLYSLQRFLEEKIFSSDDETN